MLIVFWYDIFMDSVDLKFYNQFEKASKKFDELTELLESVEVMSDNKLYVFYLKQKKEVEKIAVMFKNLKEVETEIALIEETLKNETNSLVVTEFQNEREKLIEQRTEIFENLKTESLTFGTGETEQVKLEITTKFEDDDFVQEILNLVKNIDETFEVNAQKSKTTVVEVSGVNAYEKLKFLSGQIKHIKFGKEQMILIVVLKTEKTEIEIDEKDIVIEISRSSGAGGQHINKTESAVKLTHVPTGISAECQDERSQTKNKERAFENLKKKILQKHQENIQKNIKNQRNSQRNAIFSNTPVLVFDYDKNKVSDLRTKKIYELKEILNGKVEVLQSDLRANGI